MVFNINNFFDYRNRKSKIADFQDLDHINGVSISTVSANLYNEKRDDLVLFYFRNGASHASVYTQSNIISENIKWNKKIKSKKLSALLINTRNANTLNGSSGFIAIKELANELSNRLTEKQKLDEEVPKEINSDEIISPSIKPATFNSEDPKILPSIWQVSLMKLDSFSVEELLNIKQSNHKTS